MYGLCVEASACRARHGFNFGSAFNLRKYSRSGAASIGPGAEVVLGGVAFYCAVLLLTLIERFVFSVALRTEGVGFYLVLQDFLSTRRTLLMGSAHFPCVLSLGRLGLRDTYFIYSPLVEFQQRVTFLLTLLALLLPPFSSNIPLSCRCLKLSPFSMS